MGHQVTGITSSEDLVVVGANAQNEAGTNDGNR
jgi:hypothetical protein